MTRGLLRCSRWPVTALVTVALLAAPAARAAADPGLAAGDGDAPRAQADQGAGPSGQAGTAGQTGADGQTGKEQKAQNGKARPASADPQSGEAKPPVSTIVDLERVIQGLERRPVLDLTQQEQLRFYALVTAPPIEVEKVLGDGKYDLVYGPTRGGAAMTHQEFLKMVTPEELYSSAGIQAHEQLQWSLVNIVGHAMIRKLLQDLKDAKNEREVREIRQRIAKELEAIRRQNGGGGVR